MKKNINDYGSRKLIILSIFAIVFITVFSSTYALYNYNKTGGTNTIQTGTVTLLFTEPDTDTTLVTTFVSDEEVVASDNYMEFSVSATATGAVDTSYYIYFTENEGNTIDKDLIKMNLSIYEDGVETEVVPTRYASSFTPINLDTLEEDTSSDKYLLYNNNMSFADSGSLTDTYRLRVWIDKDNFYPTYYGTSSSDRTHTAILEGEFSIKLNVYGVQGSSNVSVVPQDTCFVATVDDTAKTATLSGYLCDETNIILPSTISSYSSNTYSVKENPTDEEIEACKQVFTNMALSAYGTVCSGGTYSGYTLETFITDASLKVPYGALLSKTGVLDVVSELITLSEPYTVTAIGGQVFRGASLTDLIIPNTITTIGGRAFQNNNLRSLVLPNSVTSIGTYAFYANDLGSLMLSNAMTSIPNYAFEHNKLTTLTIPDNITSIGNEAFWNNDIYSLALSKTLKTIGASAFGNNNLISVELPNSLITIGRNSLAFNNLTSINIPSNVTTIGAWAFGANELEHVVIGENSSLTEGTGIGQYAFSSSDLIYTMNGIAYVYNPNLTTIYNNSGKSFDWQYAVNGTTGTAFETGTVAAYSGNDDSSRFHNFNSVTVTTGYPE